MARAKIVTLRRSFPIFSYEDLETRDGETRTLPTVETPLLFPMLWQQIGATHTLSGPSRRARKDIICSLLKARQSLTK